MKSVFFDIDTQIDFLYPAGALYVPGAERILPAIEHLNHYAAARSIPSAANRVLPTPASPTASTSRASPPSAPSSRESSFSRPTKSSGPDVCPAQRPAPASSNSSPT